MTLKSLIIIFLIVGVASCALFYFLSPLVFPFTTDSLFYLSTAEQLKLGKGLTFINFFVQPPEPLFLPLQIHPPGYPFLIYFVNLLGVDVYTAAMLIPRIFFLLLPVAFFMLFHLFLPTRLSLVIALMCTFVFTPLKCALIAWTDVPFLFFSLLSFYFILKALNKTIEAPAFPQSITIFALLSGLVTGGALLLRFVGYALIPSIVLALMLFSILRMIPFRKSAKIAFFYLAGFFFVFAPYLFRNWLIFGTMQPYRLPPSTVSLTGNIKDYLKAIAEIIFTHPALFWVTLVLIAALGILFVLKFKFLLTYQPKIFLGVTLLVLYFLCGSAFLIISKTRYFGPEPINDRYLLQYAWVFMAGLVGAGAYACSLLQKKHTMDVQSLTVLMMLCFLLIQVFPASDFFVYHSNVLKLKQTMEQYASLVKDKIPSEFVIMSNIPDVAYYCYRRNVRFLNGYTPWGLNKLFEGKHKFAVLLFKAEVVQAEYWEVPGMWIRPPGYRYAYSDQNVDLLFPSP